MILAEFFVVRRNCSVRFASNRDSDSIKIPAEQEQIASWHICITAQG